jgi:hypothetical protein
VLVEIEITNSNNTINTKQDKQNNKQIKSNLLGDCDSDSGSGLNV